jgi:hypothetical protein
LKKASPFGVDLVRLVTENTQARRQLYVYCQGGRYSLEKQEAAKKTQGFGQKSAQPIACSTKVCE